MNECIDEIVKATKGLVREADARDMLADLERLFIKEGSDEDLFNAVGRDLVNKTQELTRKKMSYIENAIKGKNLERLFNEQKAFKGKFQFEIAYNELINGISARQKSIFNQFQVQMSNIFDEEFGGQMTLKEFLNPSRKWDTKKLTMFIAELADNPTGRSLKSISAEDMPLYKMAKVIKRMNDELRVRMERAGIPLKYLPGRIGFQSWDTIKLRANKEGFIQQAMVKFDWQRMGKANLDDVQKDQWLREFYIDVVTGVEKADPDGLGSFTSKELVQKQSTYNRGADLQNILTKKREIFVKSKFWDEMQQEFGGGDILMNTAESIARTSRNLAMIDKLGTNPEAGLSTFLQKYSKANRETLSANGKNIANFDENDFNYQKFGELAGRYDKPDNFTLARVAQSFRKTTSTVKMGGSLIINIADASVKSTRRSMVAGGNPMRQLSMFTEEMANMFKLTKVQYGDKVAKQIWETAEAHLEDSLFDLSRQYRFADVGSNAFEVGGKYNHGNLNKFLNVSDKFNDAVYQYNGMELLTKANRKSSYVSIARDFGYIANQGYKELEDIHKFWLSDLGIEKDVWDLVRSRVKTGENGKTYLGSEFINDLTNDEVKAFLIKKGVKEPTALGIQKAKDDIILNWHSAYGREADKRVLSPGATVKAVFNRGTQRGTITGELLRNFAQLKSFPVALVQEIILPALIRKQYTSLGAFATTSIAMMTGLAIVKDLLANKTPRMLLPESDDDIGTVTQNWLGILGAAAGLPFVQEILTATGAAATEGSSIARISMGKTLLGITGPATGDLLNTGLSLASAAGGIVGGEPERAARDVGDMVTHAPFIGPLMYGHFLSRTLSATVYSSLFELWDPDYRDRLEKAAEAQGSELILD